MRRLGGVLGHLGASWEHLRAAGADFVSSWRGLGGVLGCLGSALGASWGRLGAVLERLGIVLEASWNVLGASWAVFEATLLASNIFFEACHLGNHFPIGL